MLQFGRLPGRALLAQDLQRVTGAPAATRRDSKLLPQLPHASSALLDGLPNVAFIHRLTETDVHAAHPQIDERFDSTRN